MAGLNALIQRLERLGGQQVKTAIAKKVAVAAHDACLQGFRDERDPYGVPWAPRKPVKAAFALRFGYIDDGHKLLDDTGEMINSLTSRASGDRVLIRIKDYARFHQSGTRYMVSRKIFPDTSSNLGLWSKPINDAALEAVRELMRGE